MLLIMFTQAFLLEIIKNKSFHVVSEVAFRILRDKEIEDYVNTGCPLDKADHMLFR